MNIKTCLNINYVITEYSVSTNGTIKPSRDSESTNIEVIFLRDSVATNARKAFKSIKEILGSSIILSVIANSVTSSKDCQYGRIFKR
ncbi:hypothetical protein DPMN_172243, partial [Dreissena polymorpha]